MRLLNNFGLLGRSLLQPSSFKAIAVGLVIGSFWIPTSTQAKPPEELERLKYFEGEWTCRQPADSTEPAGEFTWNVELGLNNYWYLGNAEQTLAPTDGQPIKTKEFLGYDMAMGKLVRSVVAGNGNSYSVSAEDWQDGKLVWQGTIAMQSKSTPWKLEVVQAGSDRFTTTYFVRGEDDSWLPIVDESCDREA